MLRQFFICLLCLTAIAGAGCAKQAQTRSITPMMPTVDIKAPGLSVTTTSKSVLISGQSNMENVFIDKKPVRTADGKFSLEIPLSDGQNYFQVTAGNGISTTTKTINIEKTIL